MSDVIFNDHTDEVLSAFDTQIRAALEAIGNQAVSHAKNRVAEESRIDSGTLRNEITHRVEDKECYVGTNTEYAIYNEMGTGVYIEGGRQSPWAFKDKKGEWHNTRGMKPIHMIRDAAAEHTSEYKAILERFMKG